MSVTIYGASDDLIELDGDIREEFNCFDEGLQHLAFSDGTLLSIEYSLSGIWRIHVLETGEYGVDFGDRVDPESNLLPTQVTKLEATSDEGDGGDGYPAYSDRVTLEGPTFEWAILGKVVRAPGIPEVT
jgi:hypothetical protein